MNGNDKSVQVIQRGIYKYKKESKQILRNFNDKLCFYNDGNCIINCFIISGLFSFDVIVKCFYGDNNKR